MKTLLIFFCMCYGYIIHFLFKVNIIFLLVKGQHMNFTYVTMWGLQFFPWLLPNLMVIISCSVLGFPVWPEAWGGELWNLQPHLRAVRFDCLCGDRETAWIMALPLHLWRKFPMPLCARSLDGVSLFNVLRSLHQVTLHFPSLTFPVNAWPKEVEASGSVGWVDVAPGPTLLLEGPILLWIPASLHIKASPVFSSVQENIWKICPVNSLLCSCLDFNIYLPIQGNIWWMPMGKKIRHYEKQKALFPFPFSFLSKQIHKYEKKSQRNPADCTTFIQNKGGCVGRIRSRI